MKKKEMLYDLALIDILPHELCVSTTNVGYYMSIIVYQCGVVIHFDNLGHANFYGKLEHTHTQIRNK